MEAGPDSPPIKPNPALLVPTDIGDSTAVEPLDPASGISIPRPPQEGARRGPQIPISGQPQLPLQEAGVGPRVQNPLFGPPRQVQQDYPTGPAPGENQDPPSVRPLPAESRRRRVQGGYPYPQSPRRVPPRPEVFAQMGPFPEPPSRLNPTAPIRRNSRGRTAPMRIEKTGPSRQKDFSSDREQAFLKPDNLGRPVTMANPGSVARGGQSPEPAKQTSPRVLDAVEILKNINLAKDDRAARKAREHREGLVWLAGYKDWTAANLGPLWTPMRVLGRGGYGIVGLWEYSGKRKDAPRNIVIKEAVGKSAIKSLRIEEEFLRLLTPLSNQITRMYNIFYRNPFGGARWGEDDDPSAVFVEMARDEDWVSDMGSKNTNSQWATTERSGRIILEYCNQGDLSDLLRRAHDTRDLRFSEGEVWQVFLQLSRALTAMDRGNEDFRAPQWNRDEIMHCDLKTANVLINANNGGKELVFKVADFGLGMWVPRDQVQSNDYLEEWSWRGTDRWKPPEQSLYDEYSKQSSHNFRLGTKSNVWNLGLIIQCMMRSHPSPVEIPQFLELNPAWSGKLRKLVKACLSPFHVARPTPQSLQYVIQNVLEQITLHHEQLGRQVPNRVAPPAEPKEIPDSLFWEDGIDRHAPRVAEPASMVAIDSRTSAVPTLQVQFGRNERRKSKSKGKRLWGDSDDEAEEFPVKKRILKEKERLVNLPVFFDDVLDPDERQTVLGGISNRATIAEIAARIEKLDDGVTRGPGVLSGAGYWGGIPRHSWSMEIEYEGQIVDRTQSLRRLNIGPESTIHVRQIGWFPQPSPHPPRAGSNFISILFGWQPFGKVRETYWVEVGKTDILGEIGLALAEILQVNANLCQIIHVNRRHKVDIQRTLEQNGAVDGCSFEMIQIGTSEETMDEWGGDIPDILDVIESENSLQLPQVRRGGIDIVVLATRDDGHGEPRIIHKIYPHTSVIAFCRWFVANFEPTWCNFEVARINGIPPLDINASLRANGVVDQTSVVEVRERRH